MANEQNLMPIEEVNSRRTPEQHSADSRKGGQASGVARRRKKSLKEAADYYLSLEPRNKKVWNKLSASGVEIEDIDNQMAMIAGLTARAIAGDAKAAKVIIDLLGEDGKDTGGEVQIIDDL